MPSTPSTLKSFHSFASRAGIFNSFLSSEYVAFASANAVVSARNAMRIGYVIIDTPETGKRVRLIELDQFDFEDERCATGDTRRRTSFAVTEFGWHE